MGDDYVNIITVLSYITNKTNGVGWCLRYRTAKKSSHAILNGNKMSQNVYPSFFFFFFLVISNLFYRSVFKFAPMLNFFAISRGELFGQLRFVSSTCSLASVLKRKSTLLIFFQSRMSEKILMLVCNFVFR
jgi:hypothetical protein